MSDSMDNNSGGEVIRIDKVIERGMRNPSPELQDSFQEMNMFEFSFILAGAKRDLHILRAVKVKRLANGEKSGSEELANIDFKIKKIQKIIKAGEASRTIIWSSRRGKIKHAISEFRKTWADIWTDKKQKDVNEKKMLTIAHEIGLSSEAMDSLVTNEVEAKKGLELRKAVQNILKAIFGTFKSDQLAKDEEPISVSKIRTCPHCGSSACETFCVESGRPLLKDEKNCPHCGGGCNDAFCVETGKSISQKKA